MLWASCLCSTATDPVRLEPVLGNQRSHCNEAHTPQQRGAPAHHNQRKPMHRNKDPAQPKKRQRAFVISHSVGWKADLGLTRLEI